MSAPVEPLGVAICGGLRDGRTRTALAEALAAARETSGTTELVDLREDKLPSSTPVDTDVPDAEALCETLLRADSVLPPTPTDLCDSGVPTIICLLEVAAVDSVGSAPIHLRTVSRTLRAWTLPEVAIPDLHATVDETRVRDPEVAERRPRLGRELTLHAAAADSPEQSARVPTPGVGGTTGAQPTPT